MVMNKDRDVEQDAEELDTEESGELDNEDLDEQDTEQDGGIVIADPTPPALSPVAPKPKDHGLGHLFDVPHDEDNDMFTDDLVELYEEDVFGGSSDMSDLTDVSKEDIMGKPVASRRRRKLMKRTNRPYIAPPPPTMGGMSY